MCWSVCYFVWHTVFKFQIYCSSLVIAFSFVDFPGYPCFSVQMESWVYLQKSSLRMYLPYNVSMSLLSISTTSYIRTAKDSKWQIGTNLQISLHYDHIFMIMFFRNINYTYIDITSDELRQKKYQSKSSIVLCQIFNKNNQAILHTLNIELLFSDGFNVFPSFNISSTFHQF